MAAKLMHQTKIMILLSLNAVVILIVGVMIFSAISLNGGIEFRVVSERSDVVTDVLEQVGLLTPGFNAGAAIVTPPNDGAGEDEGAGGVSQNTGSGTLSLASASSGGVRSGAVPRGQLWSETAITIYQTADFDICVGEGLSNLGEMYWQTSDTSVIKGFASSARTWLNYDSEKCRYPVIAGTGTTVITAGTYDGARYDKLTVTVIAPPVEQWKRDVLTLVNQIRLENHLQPLTWGTTCEEAANIRAHEIMTNYAHTRPDGSEWSTACPMSEAGQISGENLHTGNAAVSPETVVASWMASPEHQANILNPDFTHLAVGFVFDQNSANKTYWSQYFTNF